MLLRIRLCFHFQPPVFLIETRCTSAPIRTAEKQFCHAPNSFVMHQFAHELSMVQAIHFVLGAPGAPVLLSFLPPNQVSASKMLLKRWSSAMPLSLRTSARWCPDFDQAKGFGRKAQQLFRIFSNGCVPTLVFLPCAGGHTVFDGEVQLHTSWNMALLTKLPLEDDGLPPRPPGFTSTKQHPQWPRSWLPPSSKRPSTSMPKSSFSLVY